MAKAPATHIASTNSWRASRRRAGRRKISFRVSRREYYTMLVYAIFMLIVILVGLYVGWWSVVREEEEIPPPANTHSEVSQLPAKVI
jgi:hypothetical protein